MAITHEDVAKLVSTTDKIVNAEVERALHPNRLRRGGDTHLKSLERLLQQVSPHHIGHSLLKRLNRKGLSPGRTHSFYHRLCLAASRDNKKQLLPHWKLNSIGAGYRFVDALGVRRPQNSPAPTRFRDLEFSVPCVVKPWRGTNSRGCYLVYGDDRIVHVKDNSEFRNWSEVEQHAASLMAPERKGTRLRDSWTVEELILEDAKRRVPARDYKFYAFYGEVHLVQEIQRAPERRMSYSTRTSSGIGLCQGS